MQGKKQFRNLLWNIISRAATAALAMAVVFALTAVLTRPAQAQTPATSGGWAERVLHSFNYNGTDGWEPLASLIFDAAGNLYGTTFSGGSYGGGMVFELTPTTGGGWTEQVLYNFGGTDGWYPEASLIFDAAGNLYGTTVNGGAYGGGTVFELTPTAGGGWTEQVLYSFCAQTNCTDGANPEASLIFDAAGNLYGTTQYGGTTTYGGTVFELTPAAGGGWTEAVLYPFNRNGTDGVVPVASLIFDTAGNLYGTTLGGGTYGNEFTGGTVFELTPTAGGGWTEQVLWSFGSGTDGANPWFGLIFDAAGNLYSTTANGGGNFSGNCLEYGMDLGCGTVFELTPIGGGNWAETVLYSFCSQTNCPDGAQPYAGLIFDAAGNLYGEASVGGAYSNCTYGCGTVFELTPTGGGSWTEQVLHSFNNNGTDGYEPAAGLIFDHAGNLYGTTYEGGTGSNCGADGCGTVFELTPVYPCAKCSHSVLREGDVLPAERRDVLEQRGIGRP
jgi:uncharacterized repeat protein (TIGR03803 family)